ncbi:MAG: CPBP family intramembrane metalloprotease, partial [Erysipelotrichaceae bacterium]|nr:CPBP family intramembrane metalloprotease [Erysipelotrichaceae bacterium]
GGLVTLFISNESANEAAITQQAQSNFALIAVTTIILAPVVEELFFRGIIFRSFSRYNVVLGMVVSSLFFGFVHIYQALLAGDVSQLYYLIQYGGMGLVLAWVYVIRRNILSAIFVHLLNNAISMVILWISFGLL